MADFDSNDIFLKWQRGLNSDNPGEKYLYSERESYILDLIDMFKSSNIEMSEAKMFRNRVLETLTTKEGRKGVGKYKGWKENVLNDFDQIVADAYIEIENKEDNKSLPSFKIEKDELITSWVNEKYKGNSYILEQAHDPSSFTFIEFIEDVFGDYVV